jgi:hypothetical protein
MTDLNHRAGRWSLVTLSNDKAPRPIRACSHPCQPAPAAWGAAPGRHTADCQSRSTRSGRHPRPGPYDRLGLFTPDLKRE